MQRLIYLLCTVVEQVQEVLVDALHLVENLHSALLNFIVVIFGGIFRRPRIKQFLAVFQLRREYRQHALLSLLSLVGLTTLLCQIPLFHSVLQYRVKLETAVDHFLVEVGLLAVELLE